METPWASRGKDVEGGGIKDCDNVARDPSPFHVLPPLRPKEFTISQTALNCVE